jgi:hypothetical protein
MHAVTQQNVITSFNNILYCIIFFQKSILLTINLQLIFCVRYSIIAFFLNRWIDIENI